MVRAEGDNTLPPLNGPTLVSLSGTKRSPKWTFNGRHAPARPAVAPGPGAYALQPPDVTSRFQKSPCFGFGVSTRECMDKGAVPGPGSYSHKKVIGEEGASFSMTPRRPNRRRDVDAPGPGAHEMRTHIGEGPKYTHAPRWNESKAQMIPGPGEYEQCSDATQEKQPNWCFGTSQRPGSGAGGPGSTPGPGAYANVTSVGEGPKYSMLSKRTPAHVAPTPGPGAHVGHYSTFG
eukprot:NODE_12111_length_1245_cov_7.056351.p1 GENE.NODE_12111_length_1245_cov_7.056351~~NODE_12111_length_1245_cov_7.056351.p1  ORF type:complete len:233 (-),score=34.18 NODE_12111_length_1245_cov_7.056351:416-1114(-)